MRYLILIVLMVLAGPALAGEVRNPDGAPGTIWLDAGGTKGIDGSWKLTGPGGSTTEPSLISDAFRIGMGAVASERVTFTVAVAKDWTTFDNVTLDTSGIDQKSQQLGLQLAVRVYLGYGRR